MYAGDFSLARSEALAVLEDTPDYFLSYLPLAIANANDRQFEAARSDYQKMGALGGRAASVAAMGEADLALLVGDFDSAIALLETGRAADTRLGNANGAGYKAVQLAGALIAAQQSDLALELLAAIAAENGPISQQLPAALFYVELEKLQAQRCFMLSSKNCKRQIPSPSG